MQSDVLRAHDGGPARSFRAALTSGKRFWPWSHTKLVLSNQSATPMELHCTPTLSWLRACDGSLTSSSTEALEGGHTCSMAFASGKDQRSLALLLTASCQQQ